MKRWNPRRGILAAITGLAALMQPAYADQPPDVVESDAHGNTAAGPYALARLVVTSGAVVSNSAFGYQALYSSPTGYSNTALGYFAQYSNLSGFNNVAIGTVALSYNTTGSNNVGIGIEALVGGDSPGNNNTAVGGEALYVNSGDNNTAIGFNVLQADTTGANNTAFGTNALLWNTTGKGNEAQGVNALLSNTTGIRNLGVGSNALYSNATGSYNIALGFDAGYYQTGSDNIYIANPGVADESQTLRLGSQGTAGVQGSGILSAYIAGVATSQVTGSAVYITPSGQLGVLASAERFKTDVETMGAASERLARLRPVTFKLKTDPKGTLQYGLIAEEVAKVYPELVIHGADGRIDGVRYEELAPMLLNGVQQQQARLIAQARKADAEAQVIHELEAQADQADAQARMIHGLEAQIASLDAFKQSMLSVLRAAQSREQFARAP